MAIDKKKISILHFFLMLVILASLFFGSTYNVNRYYNRHVISHYLKIAQNAMTELDALQNEQQEMLENGYEGVKIKKISKKIILKDLYIETILKDIGERLNMDYEKILKELPDRPRLISI